MTVHEDSRSDNVRQRPRDRAGAHADRNHRQHGRALHEAALRTVGEPGGMRAPRGLGDAHGTRSPLGSRSRSPVRPRPPRFVDARSRLARERLGLQDEVRHLSVRAETTASPPERLRSRRRRGRRRRNLVVARQHRGAGGTPPTRVGLRSLVGELHPSAPHMASASRRPLGEVLHAHGRRVPRVRDAPSTRSRRHGGRSGADW